MGLLVRGLLEKVRIFNRFLRGKGTPSIVELYKIVVLYVHFSHFILALVVPLKVELAIDFNNNYCGCPILGHVRQQV